ncbi:MAG: hypothetical protein AB7P40_09865 [Chloroflexota bacterium]
MTDVEFGPEWAFPLPDFSKPAVDSKLRIGSRIFHILISPVITEVRDEPDTDLVQLMVLLDGRPLTLSDLGVQSARAPTLWSFLCSKLTELTVDFYDPQPLDNGELNPRLGCWGTRPDLLESAPEDDASLALVVGISIYRIGYNPRGRHVDFIRELGATLAEVLAYWVLRIEQDRTSAHRLTSGA